MRCRASGCWAEKTIRRSPRALLHALRYPDRSVVIDLSCMEHEAKLEYIRSVLPALNVMRRRMGTPHRIIIDEGHYFLRDAVKHHLLDLDFNGYTVVTYWPSQLPKELVAATEVILVTRESNRQEIDALRRHCTACEHLASSAWDVLPTLQIDQAVALPVTAEAGSHLQVFTIGQRLTPHVRHRQKYVDVPVRGHPCVRVSRRRSNAGRCARIRCVSSSRRSTNSMSTQRGRLSASWRLLTMDRRRLR